MYDISFFGATECKPNGVGMGYVSNGSTKKERALAACESVYGVGQCSSKACGSCNDKAYHGIEIPEPCNGATMWYYEGVDANLGCGWSSCKEVIISLDKQTWKPSCKDGSFLIVPSAKQSVPDSCKLGKYNILKYFKTIKSFIRYKWN